MVAKTVPPVESRAPLTKERVLRAAVRIADESGVDALSMRGLARDLGVEAMSLYYYVRGKDDLLGGMVELVMGEVASVDDEPDWKAAIRRLAISHHEALRRHPWATTVSASPHGISSAQTRYMDTLLRRLREAGFSPELVHRAYHALDSHIVGSTLWIANIQRGVARAGKDKKDLADLARGVLRDLPAGEHPDFAEHVRQHLSGAVRGERFFEFGLDLILDGIERLGSAGPGAGRSASRRVRRSGSGRSR